MAKRKKKEQKGYHFDQKRIVDRLILTGVYDQAKWVLLKRHGVTLEEVFGPDANRSVPHALARGHVFWLMNEKFQWSPKTIATWFGIDYSTVFRSMKHEEEAHGKENRKEVRKAQ